MYKTGNNYILHIIKIMTASQPEQWAIPVL